MKEEKKEKLGMPDPDKVKQVVKDAGNVLVLDLGYDADWLKVVRGKLSRGEKSE